MTKSFILFVMAVLVCCLFGCGNKGGVTPQASIVGNWNLQQEHVTQYINDQKQVDTTFIMSNKIYSNVQFNQNGTFTSNSVVLGNSQLEPILSTGTSTGDYSISATTFSLTNVTLAFFAQKPIPNGTPFPIIKLVSTQAQINQLTSSALSFHTELINTYTFTTDGTIQTNRWEMDYSYIK